jgi:glycosyltransferase involved in cell wall biosynthesis
VYAGRWERIKGIYTLLKAWLTTPDDGSRKRLVLASRKPDVVPQELQELFERISARNDVVLAGNLAQTQLSELYRQSHYVIIPSECVETGPLVFHEAVASGCRVISSNIGGCFELSTVYPGVSETYEVGDAAALTAKIESSADHWKPVAERYRVNTWTEHFNVITNGLFDGNLQSQKNLNSLNHG